MPRLATLTAYDPTAVSRVRLGGAEKPLAADFTAPIVDRTRDISELRLALVGLFRPDASDASLVMLQPYDSKRIPVVLIHGLNSHPRMWRNVVNELSADPQLRAGDFNTGFSNTRRVGRSVTPPCACARSLQCSVASWLGL